MYFRNPLDTKKIVFFILYQDITTYSSAAKFTRLIAGSISVQADGMLKPMKTLVVIQHHVERIL